MPAERALTLTAGCLLTLSLGSIHAFSVFVEPFELRFGARRAAVSLVYSFALVSSAAIWRLPPAARGAPS